MRITITDGSRSVDIHLRGHSAKLLRAAERSALRMLATLPPPAPEPDQQAFGFCLSVQAERAEPPYPREHDTEQYDDAPDIRRNRP